MNRTAPCAVFFVPNLYPLKTVVIVGGGFAGLHLARRLSRMPEKRVVLIDRQNHHQFQPLFYQVASARLEPANISFPFRKIFQRSPAVHFMLGEAQRIAPAENIIETSAGNVRYDQLVIASGCSTNYFGNAEIARHALPMKSTLESIEIRNRILLSFERFLSASPEEKAGLLNLVIVGAGPTGVELAGAFAEMKKYILPKDYPHTDFSGFTVTLVEGGPETLGPMKPSSRKASLNYLTRMGVVFRPNTIVTAFDGATLTFKSGETIATRNVIWAAGVTGNIIPGLVSAEVIRNRYRVDRYNKVMGYNNVFAIGDVAYMETPLYPKGHPQLANVAINQGKLLARNLRAMDKGGRLSEYEYRDLGSMATIGKHKAVVDLPRLSFHGTIAWYFWMFLHLMLILSVRNKLMIFINWAWNYLSRDSSLRLILRRPDVRP